jgi:hypothetical protein
MTKHQLFERMFMVVWDANKTEYGPGPHRRCCTSSKWDRYLATIEAMYSLAAEDEIIFNLDEAIERHKARKGGE